MAYLFLFAQQRARGSAKSPDVFEAPGVQPVFPEETKDQREDALRLIQIRLATPSLAKITPINQANSQ